MLKTTIIFFAALFISVCHAQAAAQSDGPDIRGTVSKVTRNDADNPDKLLIGSLLIEGNKEADTQLDKAVVRVSDETAIFEMRGGQRHRVSFDALKVGQRVEARFTGPVLRSYPAQARASEIVILEESSSSSLVDPTHPKAVAGQRGWEYYRSAFADLNGDGTKEKIYLVANVSLRRGRPLWDDGQIWQVYVEGAGGRRTYLYSRFVQLGHLEVMVTPSERGRARNLLIIERTPYSVGLFEISYLGRGEVRSVELLRRAGRRPHLRGRRIGVIMGIISFRIQRKESIPAQYAEEGNMSQEKEEQAATQKDKPDHDGQKPSQTMAATRVTVDEVKERMDRGEPLFFVDTRNPTAWAESD